MGKRYVILIISLLVVVGIIGLAFIPEKTEEQPKIKIEFEDFGTIQNISTKTLPSDISRTIFLVDVQQGDYNVGDTVYVFRRISNSITMYAKYILNEDDVLHLKDEQLKLELAYRSRLNIQFQSMIVNAEDTNEFERIYNVDINGNPRDITTTPYMMSHRLHSSLVNGRIYEGEYSNNDETITITLMQSMMYETYNIIRVYNTSNFRDVLGEYHLSEEEIAHLRRGQLDIVIDAVELVNSIEGRKQDHYFRFRLYSPDETLTPTHYNLDRIMIQVVKHLRDFGVVRPLVAQNVLEESTVFEVEISQNFNYQVGDVVYVVRESAIPTLIVKYELTEEDIAHLENGSMIIEIRASGEHVHTHRSIVVKEKDIESFEDLFNVQSRDLNPVNE